jgi:hypothetical protein
LNKKVSPILDMPCLKLSWEHLQLITKTN